MRVLLLGLLAVLCPLTACGGCDGGDDGDSSPDGGDTFAHESLAVHCSSRFPIAHVFPLGDDEQSFVAQILGDENLGSAGTPTTRGALTLDGGRTLSAIPIEVEVGTGELAERRASILGGVRDIAGPHAGFFSSMRPRLDAASNDAGNPLYRVLVIDGEGQEVRGVRGTTAGIPALPGGVVPDHAWRGDDQRWIARRGYRLYATEDGGASWQPIGLMPYLADGGNMVTFGARGDAVLIQDQRDPAVAGPYYLRRDDGTRVVIPVDGAAGDQSPAIYVNATMRFWGDRLVYFDRNRFWVSSDLGASWQPLPNLEHEDAGGFDAIEDAAGNLIVFPVRSRPGPTRMYRFAPGSTTPTVLDLDVEGLPLRHLASAQALSDGRLRFVAHPERTREVYGWILCEAGPGVTPGLETAVVEPLEEAATGDRIVRIARFRELSLHTDRFALSPFGRVFLRAYQSVLALPLDAPILYDANAAPASSVGHLPGAMLPRAFTWQASAFLWAQQRPTAVATFDARSGQTGEVALALAENVLAAQEAGPELLLRTERGTFLGDYLARDIDEPPVPRWNNNLVLDGPHGAVLSNLAYDRFYDLLQPEYVVRFDPWREPVPALAACYPEPPASPPPSCLPAPPMSAIAARFDLDGNLYVLDMRRGRVMMLPAGGSTWIDLAGGFLSPSDMQVRRVGDRWVVVVLDGDVFAFAADPARRKVRGADPPPARRDRAVFAARDLHDCTADGPCLYDTGAAPLDLGDGSTPRCVTGRGLGGTAGKMFAGAAELTVTAWSDAEVCAHAGGRPLLDGLLQVVRADGAASNTLPYVAAGTVTSWSVPAEVYPETLVIARGRNLGSTTGVNAWLQEGDVYASWDHQAGTHTLEVWRSTLLSSETITVQPRVHHGCRVGRIQWCTIYGAGFSTGGTVVVGGLPAAVQQWTRHAITFAWPAGLSPGVHDVVLNGTEYTASGGQVELLPDDRAPLLLQHDAPFSAALDYRHPRPVLTSRGLFANLDDWGWGTNDGVPYPAQVMSVLVEADVPELAFQRPGEPLRASSLELGLIAPGRPVHVLELAGDLYLAATSFTGNDRATVRRLLPIVLPNGTPTYDFPQVVELTTGLGNAQVAAMGEIDGRVVVVLSSLLGPGIHVVPIAVVGGTGTVGQAVQITGSYAPGGTAADRRVHGGFFSGRNLYLTTCRHPTLGARIDRRALSFTGDGALQSAPVETIVDRPAARLLACNTTADGMIWIEREAGVERVYRYVAGGAPAVVATLPAALPGVGDDFTFSANEAVPGALDVALLPGGDLLVLLNEHDSAPRGLTLARRDAAGTWSTTHVVAPATTIQPGAICVGPSSDRFWCPGHGRDGCSPVGCAVRPPELRERASAHIGEAYMVVRGDELSIIYEAVDTERVFAGALAAGMDVLHLRIAL